MSKPRSTNEGANSDLPIITHIPHSSVAIPLEDQINFLRPVTELRLETNKLNDHFTDKLFQSDSTNVRALIFTVNRFLVDVERFEEDEFESMSAKGMGALYTHDTDGNRFRADLTGSARELLLNKYYRPHHKQLAVLAEEAIARCNRALIIDAHSFPDIPLPCDENQSSNRPDICLGTDFFHTPYWLIDVVRSHFAKHGYHVEINMPYSGTMVPLSFYKKDNRLGSVMIEINRRLYLDEEYQIIELKFNELHKCINDLYDSITIESASHQYLNR